MGRAGASGSFGASGSIGASARRSETISARTERAISSGVFAPMRSPAAGWNAARASSAKPRRRKWTSMIRARFVLAIKPT